MKRNLIILLLLLFAVGLAGKTYAYNDHREDLRAKIASMSEEQKTARLRQIKARMEEIQFMDKSSLSNEDKKVLRQELRNMSKETKAIQKGGVYLSFGGIVAVIGLLIILL